MKTLAVTLSAIALFSAAAFADGVSDPDRAAAPAQKVVPYGDLNLGSQQGVVALRNRILAAAIEVCAAEALKASRTDSQCRDKAVKNAINEVGRKFSERLAAAQ